MLEVKLLGQFDARRDGVPLAIPSRAAQSLLACLLLTAGTAHRREKLAGLFWPNTLEESARHNLRHELWRVRKAIETGQPGERVESYLLADEFSIAFNANAEYWLDVAVLERARAEGAAASDLMKALALYRGELLPGFYDEWVVLERERLHAIFEQIMARLIECLVEEQHWKETLEWSERWIALGQTPEPAYRALMIAHSAMGDKSKVASAYQRCVESFRKDLGVEPSEQTRTLFERLIKTEGTLRGMKDERRVSLFDALRTPRLPQSLIPHAERSSFDEPPAPGEPPFKGLQYFDEGDADLFFGRELLTAKLAAHLSQTPSPVGAVPTGEGRGGGFLAIVGASGSGKSSIVRAGLVPALKRDNPRWQYHIITPTAHPLKALAATLTRDAESIAATTALCDDLARDPRSLRLAIKRALLRGGASHLMLVADQFEELFTLCRDEFEREAFIDNLLIAIAPERDAPVSVVVTLRADFYAHCAQYPDLREALAKHQEYIGPMSAGELRRATEEPARRGGWEFEQGLVDLILHDVGDEPGALPLLSHALLETWQRRRGPMLTLKGYAESGGVRGAIAKTAETVFHHLALDQRRIARGIFLRLTELGEGTQDTRRRAAIGELIARPEDAPAVRSVLNTLADARLITTGEGTAEVAHEALIREWTRLREWLNENREGLRLHRHLTESARSWRKLNREPGELYRGARLAQALEWAKANVGELNPVEQEFLDASRTALEREEAEREAQRRRELEAAQKLAEVERRRAEEQANERRIAFSRELSVNSVSNLNVDPERSILLALQAVSVSSAGGKPVLLEAEEALHRAVQASRVQLSFRAHKDVSGVVYSPDVKRLATASTTDKTAKVWDAVTGKELATLVGHTAGVSTAVFSPDGTRLATASDDKTAKVWDAVTGKELFTVSGHTGEVNQVAFSPDGTRLATASLDKTVKVWDVSATLNTGISTESTLSHALRNEGKAEGLNAGATTGKELLTFIAHPGGVRHVVFSPDGKRLATIPREETSEYAPKVWDAETGRLLLTLTGHTLYPWAIASSPDGKRLATAATDGTTKIWDSNSGQLAMTIFTGGFGVLYSPDGTRLAICGFDAVVSLWNAATGQLIQTLAGHSGSVVGVSFSPEGSRLATGSTDGIVKVWDITPSGSREWLTIAGSIQGVPHLAYSADGTRLATAAFDDTARVYDALTGKELLKLSGHSNGVRSVAFSPDGSRLATHGGDQTVRIWDISTPLNTGLAAGKQLLSLSAPAVFPIALCLGFSPDGQRITAAAGGGTAKVWDATTGKELLILGCHPQNANGAVFSPDGTRIAVSYDDGIAKVWDVSAALNTDATTGKELLALAGHTGSMHAVVFSPDGQRLATASADGTAKIWDATTGKELLTLSGHTGLLFNVAFSPDGKSVATTSADRTAKVWDVSTGSNRRQQPLTLYNLHSFSVTGVSFSPDGKRLAISNTAGEARIYALPIEDIVAIAKSRVTRTLTPDECRKYLHAEQCPSEP